MTTPANLKYTKSHEWVKQEADGTVTVGITHHAQEMLGDLVFIETPAVGRRLKQGEGVDPKRFLPEFRSLVRNVAEIGAIRVVLIRNEGKRSKRVEIALAD